MAGAIVNKFLEVFGLPENDDEEEYIDDEENSIFISAIEGEGIDEINKKIDKIKKIERYAENEEEDDDDEYY